MNLYAYVKNSPIMQIDSLGMLSLSVSGDIKDSALTSRRSISGVGWALDFQVKKLGYDVSIEWEKDKTTIAGKLQASAEAGIIGGIAHAFNFAGMRAWAMLGLRGYAAASFYGGISGIRECNQYFANLSFGGKITLGAQLGAMMRIFYTYDEYTEAGLYGSASLSFEVEAYGKCGGRPFTCTGDIEVKPMNTIDLSLNANLLLFEQSFSGKISLNDVSKYSESINMSGIASTIKSWLDK